MKRSSILTISVFSLAFGFLFGAGAVRFSRVSAGARGDEGVVAIDAEKVATAFQKGGMLITTGAYKVMAGHRVEPGVPEVHAADTDVFYILDGSATFVTGGKVVDPRTESPGETRGSRLDGGESRRLKKGEVIIIPRGVPHWFQEVSGPVNYFVVKVTAGGGEAGKEKPGK